MKKILTLFAVVGLMAFSSCSNDTDNDTIPQAFEIQGSFVLDKDSGFIISDDFSQYLGGDLFQSESVLVYRLEGTNSSGSDVWQLIPRDVYFSNGESITYDYNFSMQSFTIFVGGDNIANRPAFLNNQVFRFVVIPSSLISTVNKANYLEVMKAAKLNESQIKNIKF